MRKEVNAMFQVIELNAQLAQERIEREIASAATRRRWAAERAPAPSIRRAIGYRIIEIGARVAAEPSLQSARSR
jgi:hypothetical protein